jgi:hypothetical protein
MSLIVDNNDCSPSPHLHTLLTDPWKGWQKSSQSVVSVAEIGK